MSMHEVPGEFKDEERWLKFFPTRSVLILAVMGTSTIIFAKILSLFNLMILGLVIGGIITAVSVVLSMIPISTTEYMRGGGLTVDKWIFRKIHQKKNKVVYIKHYNSDIEYIENKEKEREEMLLGEENE